MPTPQGVLMSMCKVSDGRSVQSPNLRMKAVCDEYIDRLHTYICIHTVHSMYVCMIESANYHHVNFTLFVRGGPVIDYVCVCVCVVRC